MTSPKLLFTDRTSDLILEAFGFHFNKENLIEEISTGKLVETAEGETISRSEFGGIKRGNGGFPVFLKNDLWTIIGLAEEKL